MLFLTYYYFFSGNDHLNSDWTKCHPAGCVSKHWTLFLLLLYGLISCNFQYGWQLPTKQYPNWKWSKNKVWCKVSQPNIEWGLPYYYQIPHYLSWEVLLLIENDYNSPPPPHMSFSSYQPGTKVARRDIVFKMFVFLVSECLLFSAM